MGFSMEKLMNARAGKNQTYIPTTLEQVANCVTHGIWIIPSIFAAIWMYYNSGTVFHETVTLVYGTALILLFSISTTYHVLCLIGTGELSCACKVFHKGDRIVIYLFIAASYMPWLLLQDNGGLGDEIAWVLVVAAITGIFFSYFFHDKYKTIDTISYLALGILPAIPLAFLSEKALTEVAVGGFMYIAGVGFYKSDGRIPFAHAIWHLFVAAGALIHFYAIWTHLYATPV